MESAVSSRKRREGSREAEQSGGKVLEVGWGAAVVAVIALVAIAAGAWFVLGRPDDGVGGTAESADTASGVGQSSGQATGAGSGSGGAGVAPGGAAAAPTAAREPGAWFTAEGDPALGNPNAPVTLIEFSDYQCPNCRQFAVEVLPWLRQRWMGEGLVRVVFRDFAIRGNESHLAAQAAHCAGEQGLYWTYHDALFAAQSGENLGTFSAANLAQLAGTAGLDPTLFAACLESGRHAARVAASTKAAYDQGYEGTPTYLVNGRQTQGAIEIDRWEELFLLFASDIATATAASGATQ